MESRSHASFPITAVTVSYASCTKANNNMSTRQIEEAVDLPTYWTLHLMHPSIAAK